jgi:hypothetical protein
MAMVYEEKEDQDKVLEVGNHFVLSGLHCAYLCELISTH